MRVYQRCVRNCPGCPPHGLDEIIATFGDIYGFIDSDHTLNPRWQVESLERVPLPFALPLSWDLSRLVTQFTCHKLLVPVLARVFADIRDAGLQSRLTSFGGCFSFRPQRAGIKLSTHAWGIAIDLNPETNQRGTVGNMDSRIVGIFRQAGFNGEEPGKEGVAIRCTSSSALHIEQRPFTTGTQGHRENLNQASLCLCDPVVNLKLQPWRTIPIASSDSCRARR